MLSLFRPKVAAHELIGSRLIDEDSFYDTFLKDLRKCHSELIIESPFITNKRLALLLPTLQKLKQRGVRIAVNTRDPFEQDDDYHRNEAHRAIATLQRIGMCSTLPDTIENLPSLIVKFSMKGP